MDSDTDQDEDEIQQSFSVTISERGSHCRVVGKVCSDSRKGSAGVSSSSGSIEEPAMEDNLCFDNIVSDTSLSDSNSEEQSRRVIKVSSCKPKKMLSYKSIVDDRIFSAEKAVDDTFDSISDVNEKDSKNEAPPNSQDSPEQSIVHDEVVTDPQNTEDTLLLPSAVPIQMNSQVQNENIIRPEDKELQDISTPENESNDPLKSTIIANESSQPTNSRDVQNKVSEISCVDSNEAIEMLGQSLVFQSTSVVPVENTLSMHSVGASSLSEEITQRENDQDPSGTGQLAGRKRKHSGKKTADAEGAVGGSSAENSVSSGDAEESFENKDSDKDAKKKKNRCAVCRKKVGLTGFECRCGGLFCAVHRYSDKHDCTFDYREMGAQEIRRNNPVVVGEKIQKI